MTDSFQPRAHFYRPTAWLRVTGGDAAAFLQGQFTQELRSERAHPAVYGLWLNHKGRVLADSFVLRRAADEFAVASVFSPGAALRERLEAFIVADDVAVEDLTAAQAGAAVYGPGAGGVLADLGLAAPTAEEYAEDGAGGVLWRGRRARGESFEWVFPAERTAENTARLTAAVTAAGGGVDSAAEAERARICANIPAVPADIGPGELPGEGGLEAAAISYTKGCYLGQEVMARLKSMGQLRRGLRRVRGAGAPPPAGTPLFQGAKKTGELRTTARDGDGFVGFALVTLLGLDPAAGLSLAPGDAPELQLWPEGA